MDKKTFNDAMEVLSHQLTSRVDMANSRVGRAEREVQSAYADRDTIMLAVMNDHSLLDQIRDAYESGDTFYAEFLCNMLGPRGDMLRRYL